MNSLLFSEQLFVLHIRESDCICIIHEYMDVNECSRVNLNRNPNKDGPFVMGTCVPIARPPYKLLIFFFSYHLIRKLFCVLFPRQRAGNVFFFLFCVSLFIDSNLLLREKQEETSQTFTPFSIRCFSILI